MGNMTDKIIRNISLGLWLLFVVCIWMLFSKYTGATAAGFGLGGMVISLMSQIWIAAERRMQRYPPK
jgi:hypothetical protein